MERILLAVSGGIDSMCLAEKSVRSGQDFAVAHCNFHLRGADSDADADFVANWARRHGIAFYSKDFDTAAYAAEQGISLEMAARELRYGWFADLCRTEGFAGVAVAHQADDRRETFLLNLLRSSGGRGLRGMQEQSVIPGTDILLLRPLLGMTRQEIETYMRSIGATWREDGSNRDTTIRRNCIRHEVMPLLSELNPSYGDALDRAMRHIGLLQDVADTWFESVRPTLIDPADGSIRIDPLRTVAHRDYVLYALLQPFGVNESVLSDCDCSTVATIQQRRICDGLVTSTFAYTDPGINEHWNTFHSADFADCRLGAVRAFIVYQCSDKAEAVGKVRVCSGEYGFVVAGRGAVVIEGYTTSAAYRPTRI